MRGPDYTGGSLVNLVAELERIATGASQMPGLTARLDVTRAESIVLLLFDGLGFDTVAGRPEQSPLRRPLRGALDASFSTQTSVATATLATGLPPSQHGLIAYLLDLPEAGGVVNTLWWMRSDGPASGLDLEQFLPAPNMTERLAAAGWSVAVVEPEGFLGTPLDTVLYRGAETRGAADLDGLVDAVLEEAIEHRLVVGYVPHVDAAGHASGPGSAEHLAAVGQAEQVWMGLEKKLPEESLLVGTADHGMVAAGEWIDVATTAGVRIGGDSRVLFLHGDEDRCRRVAASLPGSVVTGQAAVDLWGPGPRHPNFAERLPHLLVFAPDGVAFHHEGNPTRLAGYHGGLTDRERQIPLIIRA